MDSKCLSSSLHLQLPKACLKTITDASKQDQTCNVTSSSAYFMSTDSALAKQVLCPSPKSRSTAELTYEAMKEIKMHHLEKERNE